MNIRIGDIVRFISDKLEGKVLADPTRDQIDTPIEERLIVELYSK